MSILIYYPMYSIIVYTCVRCSGFGLVVLLLFANDLKTCTQYIWGLAYRAPGARQHIFNLRTHSFFARLSPPPNTAVKKNIFVQPQFDNSIPGWYVV